ncbi:hypothetical protein STCU_10301 [Strigomonas culicis]|uniref:Uncharacterized protein n=1 Tax=Strigomonas culicis TaxID=28005 RepID=S9TNH7_9TRYP|nr:hypothetical protein STCU_10301 [Strigomonas culicis]|eukprot:EPY17943.1 hypothetical protein STCU_10301 [Strigomonas culicis]
MQLQFQQQRAAADKSPDLIRSPVLDSLGVDGFASEQANYNGKETPTHHTNANNNNNTNNPPRGAGRPTNLGTRSPFSSAAMAAPVGSDYFDGLASDEEVRSLGELQSR